MAELVSQTYTHEGNGSFLKTIVYRLTREEMKASRESIELRKNQIEDLDIELAKINSVIN